MSEGNSALVEYLGRIERSGVLPEAARAALLALPTRIRRFATYQDIIREGERPNESYFIISGLVSRHRTLRGGTRQILSFHIQGDMLDLQSVMIMIADHGIRTHMPTVVLAIAHDHLLNVAAEHPAIARAFWFETLLDAALFREWTVNVGRRNTRERTAHLLLELASRLDAAGLVRDGSFELPISQNDLADALGITAVHMNRTMQWLRRERLIRTHSRRIWIENRPAMVELAGFNRLYLHPEGARPFADAGDSTPGRLAGAA